MMLIDDVTSRAYVTLEESKYFSSVPVLWTRNRICFVQVIHYMSISKAISIFWYALARELHVWVVT